ncbi:unnamed protein product [Rhizoctonia solani]|uniref:Uncharacterized protein n=1 Tax=Rhizoctonia solani TaxID=456999 RepID=A0A8H3A2H2_9AGAM|nr:unnamed protein product [Rhizoctonia solani]
MWSASRPVGAGMWKAQAWPIARPSGGLIQRDDRKMPRFGFMRRVYNLRVPNIYSYGESKHIDVSRLTQPTFQPPCSSVPTPIVTDSDQQTNTGYTERLVLPAWERWSRL